MNAIQNFLLRLAGQKLNSPSSKSAGYLSFKENGLILGQDMSQKTFLESYRSWVYAAVTKRADTFSNLKLTLNRIVKKGKETEFETVKEHPVLELLDRVNPYVSFPDLLKIHQTYKDLTGNAYWWLIKEGNTIVEIWPYLRPDRMSVIPSAENFIGGYNYLVPGKGEYVKFQPDEIIHFKYPNPLDPYTGVSPMEACYLAFNTYIRSSEFNNRFFSNNARADFLLSFPNGLSDPEQKQIRAQWENRHRGVGHEHRFAIISGDAKVQTVGVSQKDMEFMEQMKFTRDEILAIFKVPKALLDPQELNYASAQVAKEVFTEEVVVPLMQDFVTQLNEFLLPFYGDDSLFFDFESPTHENPEAKRLRYQTLSSVGAISPNEIREEEGLPPFEGGDSIYLSALVQPIGEAEMDQTKMIGTDKTKRHPKHNVQVKSRSKMADLKQEAKEGIKKQLSEKTLKKKEIVMPPEKPKLTEKEAFGQMAWESKIVKTNEHERQMRRDLSAEFNRQEDQVIRSLHEKSFDFNFDVEDEAGIFVRTFNPFYKEVLKAYGEDALDIVNMSGFKFTDRVQDWLESNVREFATEVNKTTKDKITKALQKAVEEGEGIADAGRRVREVFTEANVSRAKTIARTEISHASNYATVEGWKQSDVVEQKEWFTALDERADEVCLALHGTVIDLNDSFNVGDEIFGDPKEPPAHVNCRCRLLPVLKTKSVIADEFKALKEEAKKEITEIREIKEKLNQAIADDNG